jgi:GntR family transcriptional regulator, transcriptional repressor for pyruvate dehydrogenase complex
MQHFAEQEAQLQDIPVKSESGFCVTHGYRNVVEFLKVDHFGIPLYPLTRGCRARRSDRHPGVASLPAKQYTFATMPRPKRSTEVQPGLFHAVTRDETLASRVCADLERLISEGQLVTGQCLPSERDLGEKLGVSRTVVREAVRSLLAKGLLEIRAGNGTYVRAYGQEDAAEALSRLFRGARTDEAKHIYELRRPIEVAMAGLAAERARDTDVAELRRLADKLIQPLSDAEFVQTDVLFHEALARATGNPLLQAFLGSLSGMLTTLRQLGLQLPGARNHAHSSHSRITDAIEKRSPNAAMKAMQEHMDYSETVLKKAAKGISAPGKPKKRPR